MAKQGAVWGIDIGQCALKALCCRPHEKDEGRIVVEAFDYVEYSKILTQPEADREELVREALATFLSRNDVNEARVAISVPGQSGLARFIKLPPVEAKKIPDIVKYEARQQIPFALEDVVWDYQPLPGSSQEEGYALETEVGIFAMKRDQVGKILQPLDEAGIDVDFIQLAPLALYNFLCFDRMGNLETLGAFDPEKPPESTVLISLGTDTTDLVITNGFRVWQRNIPIGGNHFTKALTKELRLTFSKAEHLKRNATKAEDPKAVFQAMRPVFSDLVSEIQRSIGFFTSNNRRAKLGEIYAMGNPMKLPGLQRYLSQNLDQEIKPIDQFSTLVGGSATASPQFQENVLSFPVSYGLCIQAMGRAQIHTNLLPREIVTSRLVRAKKPWTVAAAAILMLGILVNYGSHYFAWSSAVIEGNQQMENAIRASKNWNQQAQQWVQAHSELTAKFDEIQRIGQSLHSNVDGRLLWLELLKGIDSALPKDTRDPEEREQTAKDVQERNELHITSMDCQYFPDLSAWQQGVNRNYQEWQAIKKAHEEGKPAPEGAETPAAESPDATAGEDAALAEADTAYDEGSYDDASYTDPSMGGDMAGAGAAGVAGPGWVIQLVGYHFHNADRGGNEGGTFVGNTLLTNLEERTIQLPDGPNGEMVDVKLSDLGISFPVLITKNPIRDVVYDPEASGGDSPSGTGYSESRTYRRGSGRGPTGPDGNEEPEKELWKLRQYDFIVQFAWKPTPRSVRLNKAKQQAGQIGETAAVGESSPDGHRG